VLFHWFIAVWNQRALTKNCGYNNYGMYDMALLEEIHLVAKDHLGNWVTKHPLERDGVSFVPNLQNIKNREYGLTKLLREASPQAVVIAADLDDAASAADANLPDLAPVILADGDMEDAVEVADASGRAVEHEMEKPEGVLSLSCSWCSTERRSSPAARVPKHRRLWTGRAGSSCAKITITR